VFFIAQLGAKSHPNGQILMVMFGSGYSTFHEKTYKGSDMKKKLLVLLIAITPALIPSLAFACAPEWNEVGPSGCCPGLTDVAGICMKN
jgi:hypothetical protein